MNKTYDVAIVGAGLAGSTLGYLLARRGYSVALLEKESFPRGKVCGEGLLPRGARLLEEIGLIRSFYAAGAVPFRSLQIVARSARLQLSLGDSGLLFERTAADALLARFVAQQPSLDLLAEAPLAGLDRTSDHVDLEVRGKSPGRLRASVIVGADGSKSRVRQLLGIKSRVSGGKRYALGAHVGAQLTRPGEVQIHVGPPGEAYLASQQSQSSATLLLHADRRARATSDLRSLFRSRFAEFPTLADYAADLQFCGDVRATAPLAVSVESTVADRALLIGDAAGTMDPILGQGMSVALVDARNAAGVIDCAFTRNDFSLATLLQFSNMRKRYFDPLRRSAAWLVAISRRRWLAALLLYPLETRPALRGYFLRQILQAH